MGILQQLQGILGEAGKSRTNDGTFAAQLQSPATTNNYKVSLHLADTGGANADTDLSGWLSSAGVFGKDNPERFDFLCSETFIPGTNVAPFEVFGDRQGMYESFSGPRRDMEVAFTFYVSSEYQTLRLFEEWVNFMNPIYAPDKLTSGSPGGYEGLIDQIPVYRFRYPQQYKRMISLTKFERDYRDNIIYAFVNAFPTNIESIPLSYDAAQLLKVSITMRYDRKVIIQSGRRTVNNQENSMLVGEFQSGPNTLTQQWLRNGQIETTTSAIQP
tara:strand:+ start:3594 stop:4409 length:816 start_codon:yes stop_codon:yes gene_type:complete